MDLTFQTYQQSFLVAKWCEYHTANVLTSRNYREKSEEIQEWERQFLDVGQIILFDILRAAHELGIPELLDCSCKKAAAMVSDFLLKTLERTFC